MFLTIGNLYSKSNGNLYSKSKNLFFFVCSFCILNSPSEHVGQDFINELVQNINNLKSEEGEGQYLPFSYLLKGKYNLEQHCKNIMKEEEYTLCCCIPIKFNVVDNSIIDIVRRYEPYSDDFKEHKKESKKFYNVNINDPANENGKKITNVYKTEKTKIKNFEKTLLNKIEYIFTKILEEIKDKEVDVFRDRDYDDILRYVIFTQNDNTFTLNIRVFCEFCLKLNDVYHLSGEINNLIFELRPFIEKVMSFEKMDEVIFGPQLNHELEVIWDRIKNSYNGIIDTVKLCFLNSIFKDIKEYILNLDGKAEMFRVEKEVVETCNNFDKEVYDEQIEEEEEEEINENNNKKEKIKLIKSDLNNGKSIKEVKLKNLLTKLIGFIVEKNIANVDDKVGKLSDEENKKISTIDNQVLHVRIRDNCCFIQQWINLFYLISEFTSYTDFIVLEPNNCKGIVEKFKPLKSQLKEKSFDELIKNLCDFFSNIKNIPQFYVDGAVTFFKENKINDVIFASPALVDLIEKMLFMYYKKLFLSLINLYSLSSKEDVHKISTTVNANWESFYEIKSIINEISNGSYQEERIDELIKQIVALGKRYSQKDSNSQIYSESIGLLPQIHDCCKYIDIKNFIELLKTELVCFEKYAYKDLLFVSIFDYILNCLKKIQGEIYEESYIEARRILKKEEISNDDIKSLLENLGLLTHEISPFLDDEITGKIEEKKKKQITRCIDTIILNSLFLKLTKKIDNLNEKNTVKASKVNTIEEYDVTLKKEEGEKENNIDVLQWYISFWEDLSYCFSFDGNNDLSEFAKTIEKNFYEKNVEIVKKLEFCSKDENPVEIVLEKNWSKLTKKINEKIEAIGKNNFNNFLKSWKNAFKKFKKHFKKAFGVCIDKGANYNKFGEKKNIKKNEDMEKIKKKISLSTSAINFFAIYDFLSKCALDNNKKEEPLNSTEAFNCLNYLNTFTQTINTLGKNMKIKKKDVDSYFTTENCEKLNKYFEPIKKAITEIFEYLKDGITEIFNSLKEKIDANSLKKLLNEEYDSMFEPILWFLDKREGKDKNKYDIKDCFEYDNKINIGILQHFAKIIAKISNREAVFENFNDDFFITMKLIKNFLEKDCPNEKEINVINDNLQKVFSYFWDKYKEKNRRRAKTFICLASQLDEKELKNGIDELKKRLKKNLAPKKYLKYKETERNEFLESLMKLIKNCNGIEKEFQNGEKDFDEIIKEKGLVNVNLKIINPFLDYFLTYYLKEGKELLHNPDFNNEINPENNEIKPNDEKKGNHLGKERIDLYEYLTRDYSKNTRSSLYENNNDVKDKKEEKKEEKNFEDLEKDFFEENKNDIYLKTYLDESILLENNVKEKIRSLFEKYIIPFSPEVQEVICSKFLKKVSGDVVEGEETVENLGTKGTAAEAFVYRNNIKNPNGLLIKIIRPEMQCKSEVKMLYEALINLKIKQNLRTEHKKCKKPDCGCKNVVNIYNVFYCNEAISKYFNGALVVVMDYADGGDMKNKIKYDYKDLSLKTISSYFKQLVDGLRFLHSLNILHMDVKLANIVFGNDGLLKLIDFGYSIFYNDKHNLQNNIKYVPSNSFWVMSLKQFELFFKQFEIEIKEKCNKKIKQEIQKLITEWLFDNNNDDNKQIDHIYSQNEDFNIFNYISKEKITFLTNKTPAQRELWLNNKDFVISKEANVNSKNNFISKLLNIYKIYDLLFDKNTYSIKNNDLISKSKIEEKVMTHLLDNNKKLFQDENINNFIREKINNNIAIKIGDYFYDESKIEELRSKFKNLKENDNNFKKGYNVFQSDWCALLTYVLALSFRPFFRQIFIEDLEKDAKDKLDQIDRQKMDNILDKYCFLLFNKIFAVDLNETDWEKDGVDKYIFEPRKVFLNKEIESMLPCEIKEVVEYLMNTCFIHNENFKEKMEDGVISFLLNCELYNYAKKIKEKGEKEKNKIILDNNVVEEGFEQIEKMEKMEEMKNKCLEKFLNIVECRQKKMERRNSFDDRKIERNNNKVLDRKKSFENKYKDKSGVGIKKYKGEKSEGKKSIEYVRKLVELLPLLEFYCKHIKKENDEINQLLKLAELYDDFFQEEGLSDYFISKNQDKWEKFSDFDLSSYFYNPDKLEILLKKKFIKKCNLNEKDKVLFQKLKKEKIKEFIKNQEEILKKNENLIEEDNKKDMKIKINPEWFKFYKEEERYYKYFTKLIDAVKEIEKKELICLKLTIENPLDNEKSEECWVLVETLNSYEKIGMFKNIENLKEVEIYAPKNLIGQITDLEYMFYGCTSLEKVSWSIREGNWNSKKICKNSKISNITNMSHMFYNCTSLYDVNLNNFNLENVTDMSYMFYNCSSILVCPDYIRKVYAGQFYLYINKYILCTPLSKEVFDDELHNGAFLKFLKDDNINLNCIEKGLAIFDPEKNEKDNKDKLFYISDNINDIVKRNLNALSFILYKHKDLNLTEEQYKKYEEKKKQGEKFLEDNKMGKRIYPKDYTVKMFDFIIDEIYNLTGEDPIYKEIFDYLYRGLNPKNENLKKIINKEDKNSINSINSINPFKRGIYETKILNSRVCEKIRKRKNLNCEDFFDFYTLILVCNPNNFNKFNKVPIENFNTKNVKNMAYMFYNCQGLLNVDLSKWDFSSVKNLEGLFANCNCMVNVTLGKNQDAEDNNIINFDDDKKNTIARNYMFYNCKNLLHVELNDKIANIKDPANSRNMFLGNAKLSGISCNEKCKDNIAKNKKILGLLKVYKKQKNFLNKNNEVDFYKKFDTEDVNDVKKKAFDPYNFYGSGKVYNFLKCVNQKAFLENIQKDPNFSFDIIETTNCKAEELEKQNSQIINKYREGYSIFDIIIEDSDNKIKRYLIATTNFYNEFFEYNKSILYVNCLHSSKKAKVTKDLNYVFYECPKVMYVNLYELSSEKINGTFYNCKRLQVVKLPKNCQEIQDISFAYCYELSCLDGQKNIIKVSQNKAFLFTSRLFYLKCPDVYNIFPLNKEEDVHQGNIAKIFDTYPKKDVSFSENICKIACLNDHEKVYQKDFTYFLIEGNNKKNNLQIFNFDNDWFELESFNSYKDLIYNDYENFNDEHKNIEYILRKIEERLGKLINNMKFWNDDKNYAKNINNFREVFEDKNLEEEEKKIENIKASIPIIKKKKKQSKLKKFNG